MPDKSNKKKTEVTLLMLHKVELRPEIIQEIRHIIRLPAASLNEDVLLDTWVLMTTLIFKKKCFRRVNKTWETLIIEDLNLYQMKIDQVDKNFIRLLKT